VPRGRPSPPAKVRARRRLVAGLIVTVLFAGFLVFAVFPTRTWLQQRRDTAAAEAELAKVKAERAEVERERKKLQTDEEIARRARDELGMVNPGEESYDVLPPPVEPIGLPPGWPFTGVERVLGAE
jgi:cell division protein FtsB